MPKRKMVPVIVMMGGGSYGWSPMLMNDILQVQGLEEAEIRVLDINAEAAELMSRLLGMMAQRRGRAITVKATDNQREAFRNADFVVITISTGGLDASEEDMAIPERYGIYQTVGDTVGPGGWSRSIRNIPVLQRVAKDLKELSPQAVILNYTNPMGTLTKALCVESNLRCVGLCHGLFEVYALLQDVFDLESESEIRLNVAGMNHFFWVLDFTIKGEPGYPLLQKKLKGKANFAELVGGDYQYNIYADRRTRTDRKKGPSAEANSYWVCGELLKEYGRLPYIGDRHTVEFLSRYLAPDEARLNASNVKRTPISERVEGMAKAKEQTVAMVEGKEPLPEDRSREAAADIMSAIVHSTEFV
ncbi:MAG: hypothetical protein HQ546_07720, partial [Planctomycetes bacterium]|nr:hypothetical protein [Planctomycetota bacterium]